METTESNPVHELNTLRAPYIRRKTLNPAKVQPKTPEKDTKELTNLVENQPGILKATDITGLRVIDISARSRRETSILSTIHSTNCEPSNPTTGTGNGK